MKYNKTLQLTQKASFVLCTALLSIFAQNKGRFLGQLNLALMGVKTKYKGFKVAYDYRSLQRNFAPGVFIDSDFNGGHTNARGHRFNLAYAISKNFSVGGTYFAAERFDHNDPARNYDIFQLDLKAKF